MAFAPRTRYTWQLRSRTMPLGDHTAVMAILNVTPDSFSDGGLYAGQGRAAQRALQLLAEGADILDVGGESTRPGAPARTPNAISAEEEQRRILPVIEAVLRAEPSAVISVDTYRAATARAAVCAGAEIVNDVSGGLWDADMLPTCAELGCGVVLMHTRGLPSEWAGHTPLRPEEVVPQVLSDLESRVHAALDAGIARERLLIDPGLGFGKRGAENWALLHGLHRFAQCGLPLLVGLSRKGFLSLDREAEPANERDDLTHAADVLAIAAGAHVIRVHDVHGARRTAAIADTVTSG